MERLPPLCSLIRRRAGDRWALLLQPSPILHAVGLGIVVAVDGLHDLVVTPIALGHVGELAEAVGVSRQTVNAIEKGEYNPTINLCRSICKVLGKTLDDLFWEE